MTSFLRRPHFRLFYAATTSLGLIFMFGAPAARAASWYVRPGGGGDATTIQGGLALAQAGDSVRVTAGTYFEHDLQLPPGVTLGGESGRDSTIIDAQGLGHGVIGADNAVVQGFTIQHAGPLNHHAVYCYQTSPAVLSNRFVDNYERTIVLVRSTSEIAGNEFVVYAPSPSTHVYSAGSTPWMHDNVFNADDPNGNISAIELSDGVPGGVGAARIENNVIYGRTFISSLARSDTTRVTGNVCVVRNGFSEAFNIAFSPSPLLIRNNTMVGGSGVFLQGNSTATLLRNIVVDARYGVQAYDGNIALDCNDIFNCQTSYAGVVSPGPHDFSADPLFCGAAAGDYRLHDTSPCAPGLVPGACGLVGALQVACFSAGHTITATAGTGGSIFPSGVIQVANGSSLTFTITADNGYHVSGVLVDGVGVGPVTSYTFDNVVSDHSIFAAFRVTSTLGVLDINNLRMLVTAAGSFAFDPDFGSPGLEFPKGSGKSVVFASGLWLGAMVDGAARIALSEYSDEFAPGAMVNGGPDDPTRPEYRVHRLDRRYPSTGARDSALAAYNAGAVPHGAPPVSVLPNGDLDIPGDQMLWHVYNDAVPVRHTNRAGHTQPLSVEVQQTAYAFDRSGALGNTAFLKFMIINKGPHLLEDMYVALWSDPDLGGESDDLVGCDSSRSLGYCYNGTNNDPIYGSAPPAVGYDLVSVAKAGAPAKEATAFLQYLNGGDPANATQTYHLLSGRLVDGSPIINPITNQPTTYFYTGDPITATGWLDTNPSDRRFLLPSGPFTLAPGESLEVVGAIVVGDGTDRLSSIAKLRNYDDQVQRFLGSSDCQIAMSLRLSPRVLSLASRGRWVTGYLEPPAPWAPEQIDVASIRLNGTVRVDSAASVTIGDFNHNGVADIALRFDRAAVELQLAAGDSVPISVTGTVGGQCFIALDTIRVLRAIVHAPAAGAVLSPGTTAVRWEIAAGAGNESVALLWSLDDGANWQIIASGVPNSGSYDWTVPAVTTQQARVAIVLVESSDESGYLVDGVLGVSGKFSISGVTGVAPGERAAFALRGVAPNPARDIVRISFILPDERPATLELFDVSGRQMATRRVGGTGLGWHVVELGGREKLPTGIYIIRLTHGGRSLTARAALVR